jgi:hypothetical protein
MSNTDGCAFSISSKQNNSIGLLAYLIDENAAFFISDISRRRTVEQGC